MVVPRTQCISIIDESSPSIATHTNDWNNFRANFPNNNGTGREFWLLQPAGTSWDVGDLNRPNNFLNDSLANGAVGGGTFTVNRDNGNIASRSDWFAITNMASQPPGSYVSVWLDISGSMVYNTVRASYEYFVEQCTSAGINIILETSNSGERWIPGHNQFFQPSASFSADPNFLTNFNQINSVTIPYGSSASLSWIVFGDTNSASIDGGIGTVSDPSGVVAVSPLATTVYTLTAVGPVGSTTRSVTVVVLPPPPPEVTFTVTPTSYINPSSATLSWTVTGVSVDVIDIDQGIGSVLNLTDASGNGSLVVNPTASRTYTITAKNFGGAQGSTTSKSVTLTVYQPTIANIVAIPNPITVGQESILEWVVQGDASEAYINPLVSQTGEVLLVSQTTVTPVTSTRYILTANGPGGLDEAFVDLKVCQLPTIIGNFPVNIFYSVDFTVQVEFSAATGGAGVIATYTDVESTTTTETINLGSSGSDEITTTQTVTFNSNIPWSNRGPKTIVYQLFANGCGGNLIGEAKTVNVEIDLLPDLVNIPDSLNKIPLDTVESPDFDTIISDPIFVSDIDIPVEIKSDFPIQVRFDDADPAIETNWNNVREI